MRPLRSSFLIAAVACAAYASSFGGVLVFDDLPAIADNPNIRSLWPLSQAMAAPPDTTVSGRPIASLSFALNYALAPGDVAGHLRAYHAVNLAIHVFAALTLFGIVRRTLTSDRMRDRFGAVATPLATVIALVWAVHPLQTGSVTYVVQRAESLMGLFYLLTLYCAIRGWTAAAIAACVFGMATKESMVTAPLIVVVWDWLFGMRRRWPLYAALAATWAIVGVLVAGGYRAHSVGFGLRGWTWWSYLITQAGVVTHYLRLAFVPRPLVLDYGWPAARSLAEVLVPAVIVVSLLALTAFALMRRWPVAFAGVWFFAILAPTSSVIPIVTEVAAEHRMYLPLAAVIGVVVLGVFSLTDRRATRPARQAFALAAIVSFAVMTDARNRDYHSFDGIWLDTIEKRPANARARVNYASALLEQHRYREAEEHLRAAVGVEPDSPEARADLGVALPAQGQVDEAVAHLQRAIAIQPDYVAAHQNLGEAYATQGRLGPAATEFAAALTLRPDDVMLLTRTGWIRATATQDDVRDGREAVTLAERAVRLTNRQDVASLDTLGAAYGEVDRFEDAERVAKEAVTLARIKDPSMVPEIEQRLAAYRDHRKIRE